MSILLFLHCCLYFCLANRFIYTYLIGKAFLSALLKYHWQIESIYISGMQHDIHCEMIATIKHPSPHIVTFGCVCGCVCGEHVRVWVCMCVVRTLKIYFLSQLQEDPGVLLTRVTMLYFGSPGLFLSLEVYNLWPTSPQFPPFPAPANHISSLYFCEFEVFEGFHQMSNMIRAVG